MPTSYRIVFRVQQAQVNNMSNWFVTREYGFIGTSFISQTGSTIEVIDNLLGDLIALFGGTYTVAIETVQAHPNIGQCQQYTIDWIDLTTDPRDTADGDFVQMAMTAKNVEQSVYRSTMLEVPPECQPATVCDTCLELTRQACQESYTFDVDLDAATEYTVAITLPSGNIYTQEVTTNGSGSFTLDATAPEFPSGLFLPETGPVKIEVFSDGSLTTPLELLVNATEYTCINLNFAYITTTTSSLLPEFSFLLHDYEGEINFQIITDQNDSFLIDE